MNPSATTLPSSLQSIVDACQHSGVATAADAVRILRSANVTQDDLLPWADFDHPIRDGYGRQPVVLGDTYELMVMSWKPGDFSAIHDHGNTQWGAVLYFGEAEHASYQIDDGVLRTQERTRVYHGDINPVDHDLIHQMGNPTDQTMMSLHLYGCDTPVDGITGDARIFDLLDHTIQYTDGGVFYCLEENLINRRGPGMGADRATVVEHHHQMLARIRRIQADAGAYDPSLDFVAQRLAIDLTRVDSLSELAV